MGRTRARLARSELDGQVQGHVATAERSIQAALQIVRKARRGQHSAPSSRYLRVEKELARALAALAQVSQVTPLHDTEDPDLNESALDRWRADRAAEAERMKQVEAEVAAEVAEGGDAEVNDG